MPGGKPPTPNPAHFPKIALYPTHVAQIRDFRHYTRISSARILVGKANHAMDLSMFFSPNLLQNAAVLTLILAFVSYLATFMSARMLARRKDKLELVNRRLNEFYGPLYVASQAGSIAYRSLLKKQGKTQSFPILDEEMKEWVLWMTTIFMPLNDVREKIIIEKAYLIVEEQMPHCLLDFVTHVVGYKAVLAKWAEGDYTERRSTIGWPPEFDLYVERSYAALKAKQTRLLHSALWQLYHRLIGRKRR
jgi:hypothetical protein